MYKYMASYDAITELQSQKCVLTHEEIQRMRIQNYVEAATELEVVEHVIAERMYIRVCYALEMLSGESTNPISVKSVITNFCSVVSQKM